MSAVIEALRDALTELGATGAVVFSATGEEVCRVGDLEEVQKQGVFKALFGGPEAVRRLRESLEGQLLPQIWSQGGTDCFVSKLSDGTLYGVFSQRALDAVGLYHASQDTARAIDVILQGSHKE